MRLKGNIQTISLSLLLAFSCMVITHAGFVSAANEVTFAFPFSSNGLDTNGDHLYEYLVVNVSVNVNVPGDYHVEGEFYQPPITVYSYTRNYTSYTEPGPNITRLWIPGDRIFESGVSGPYYVHVSVVEGNESMNSSLIICETDYYAGIFNYTDFTHTHFDASISDYGVDSNSDWLYESLRVEVPVTVEWGNYYSLWAYLVYPSNGTKVLSIDYRYLNTGPGILQANFSSDLFSTHRLDGPYCIELNIHDYTWNLNIDMVYATHAYNWTDFALPAPVPTPIELTPLHFDFPVDSNADSKYESLTVDVGVNVTEPGWYQTLAQLYSNGTRWTSNAWAANYSLQDVGFNYTRLSFTSPDIVSSLLSGTFYVAVAIHAYDDYSHRYSTADYTLGNYQISDFVAMQPHLETNYSDYGLDSDEDGLFNFLILEIGVHAPVEEEVIFRAWVNGVSTNSTGPVMTVTTVPAGHSTVDLVLNGELFADAQVNGPYEIYVFMTYASESFIMDHTYTTGYYEWTQFSNPGATFGDPHRDNGLDVNGDRAFEYLAIYANVSVQAPGYYNVTLAFWSPPLPGILWNRTYLDKGQNYVGFLIPGDWVKAVRYNGSFWLELDLYDAVGVHLWDSKHITSYYRWMDFAKPPIASFVVEVPPAGNMSYTFDASLSSVDAVFYEVRWDFDADGEWDTGWSMNSTINHVFPGPGNYTVIMELRDLRGLTSVSQLTVNVPPWNPDAKILPGNGYLPYIVTAALVTAAVGVVVFLAWPLELLIVAAVGLAMPLYSRLRRDSVLENYRRGMIHGLILAHPGISFTEIRDALEISTGSLVYHLGILQSGEEVSCKKSGTLMRYYLKGTPVMQIARLGLTDFQAQIIQHISSRGSITKPELRKALSSSRQTLHYNLKKLVTDNLLVTSLYGGHRIYRLSTGVDWHLIKAMSEGNGEVPAPSTVPEEPKTDAADLVK